MTDLTLSVQISTGATTWTELEDAVNGYEIGANSFTERTLAQKQHTVGDDAVWVRGVPVIASTPGNVTEPLEVYVSGPSQAVFDARLQALVGWLTGQVTYQIKRVINNSRQTWNCFACADLRIQTSQPLIFATEGVVIAQVPRLPDMTLETLP